MAVKRCRLRDKDHTANLARSPSAVIGWAMARQLYQGAMMFHGHNKVSRDATPYFGTQPHCLQVKLARHCPQV
jgi:hypothetical protein